MEKNRSLDGLIYLFSKLPGLGIRSARRIVLQLLQDKHIRMKPIIENLQKVFDEIVQCKICGNLDSIVICGICSNPSRSNKLIAIVETVADLWAIERSGGFNGKYHILGSIANNYNQDDSNLAMLYQRCKTECAEELIIATNSTLDGQTMAYYIIEYFKTLQIKTTRLASGIPLGGELDYLDEGTLLAGIQKRTAFE